MDNDQLFKLTLFVSREQMKQLLLWASSVQQPWMGLSQEDDDGAFKAHVTRLNNATVGEVIYTTPVDGS
jgi:hypothetical protein